MPRRGSLGFSFAPSASGHFLPHDALGLGLGGFDPFAAAVVRAELFAHLLERFHAEMFLARAPAPPQRLAVPSSPLKKAPGEGTGPTIHVDFRGNLVGRVPSRGEQDVFEQAARLVPRQASASVPRKVRRSASSWKIGSRRSTPVHHRANGTRKFDCESASHEGNLNSGQSWSIQKCRICGTSLCH
jgi:hypothetical protein